MKLALVTHLLNSEGGGVARVVDDLVANLPGSIDCMKFGLQDSSFSFSVKDGFKIGRYGIDTDLSERIISWKPDLIHLHGLFTFVSYSVLRATRYLNVPLVVSPHGMLDAWAINNGRLKKRIFFSLIEKKVLSSASCIHALNSSEMRSIKALLSDKRNLHFKTIPNGVVSGDRLVLNKSDSKFNLLYLGRIHPKKGVAELIQALSVCKKVDPDLRHKLLVNVVGWGDSSYLKYLSDVVSDLGLQEIVVFRGPAFNEDKGRYFSAADAFILPSRSEGLPMAVLEAWSYSLPVLITPECNLDIGFQANAAIPIELDPAQLSTSLLSLLRLERSILKEMGHRGLQLTKQEFTWDVIGKKYLEMYVEVSQFYAFK